MQLTRQPYEQVPTTQDDDAIEGSPHGSGVGGLPSVEVWVVASIGLVGGLAVALSIAAEVTRVKTFQSLVDGSGAVLCVYPSSPAGGYAATAGAALLAAQLVALLCSGLSWCYAHRPDTSRNRSLLLVVLATNIIFLFASLSTLTIASKDNAKLSSNSSAASVPPAHPSPPCAIEDSGLFLSASLLTAFTVLLMEAYYLAAMRSLQYAWLAARYCSVPAVQLEAFHREATMASVVPVATVQEGDGGDMESGAKEA